MLHRGKKKYKGLAVLCFVFLLGKNNLIYKGKKKISMQKVKRTFLLQSICFHFSYSLKIPQHFFMADIQRQPVYLTLTGYKILQIIVIQTCPVHQFFRWRQTLRAIQVSCGSQLKLHFKVTGFSRDPVLQCPASNCRIQGLRISVHLMNFPVISFSKAATVYFSLFLANKNWAKGKLVIRL